MKIEIEIADAKADCLHCWLVEAILAHAARQRGAPPHAYDAAEALSALAVVAGFVAKDIAGRAPERFAEERGGFLNTFNSIAPPPRPRLVNCH